MATKPTSTAAKSVKSSASKTVKRAALPAKAAQVTKASKVPASTKVAAAPAKQPAAKRTSAVAPVKKAPPAPAKVKLVRDSFTLPEMDHDLIKQCKKAAIAAGRETKKSEVVRAAIRAFCALPVTSQLAGYAALQPIAVGRPKSK